MMTPDEDLLSRSHVPGNDPATEIEARTDMRNVWALASLWVGLALLATLMAIWFKISTALTEIVVGTVAQLFIGALVGSMGLGASSGWIRFLAGTGAIVLTFLAGAELNPVIFRTKWKEAMVVGLVGFPGPFLACSRYRKQGIGQCPSDENE
jgi:glutathione-regulated potassium-efflux system ancillary protein KefC